MAAAITVRTDRGEERLELEEFEARVIRGDIAPQCPTRFPPVTGERWVPAGSLELFRLRYSPRELRFSSNFRFGGVPWVTFGFTALCILWYVAMQLWPKGTPDDTLIAYGAKAGPLLLDLGQFWRLLTANFVHRDLLHIGMNLFVLFNFAGALENAFRPWDMVLVLLASALGTTILSAVVTDPISAGASGVAYGALGAAVVFGLKYRTLLPERYRRVLGGAVVPTVLVFLFLGFTSTGVDNWGHLGGLLAGSMTTACLKPRLLSDRPTARTVFLTRWLPVGLVLATLFLLGPATRFCLPELAARADDDLGIAVRVPAEWESTPGALGGHAYFNGLAGFGEARLSVGGSLSEEPPDAPAILDDLLQKELWEPETDEHLQVMHTGPVQPVELGDTHLSGLRRDAIFRRGGTLFEFRSLVLVRGHYVYVIEGTFDRAQGRYHALFDDLFTHISVAEPSAVTQARTLRLLLPGFPAPREALVDAQAAAGIP